METSYELLNVIDREVLQVVLNTATKGFAGELPTINWQIGGQARTLHCDAAMNSEELQICQSAECAVLDFLNADWANAGFPAKIEFSRPANQNPRIKLSLLDQNDPSQRAKFVFILQSMQAALPPPTSSLLLRKIDPGLAEFYRAREETVLRLERMYAQILEEHEKYKLRVEASVADKQKELQKQFEARESELNAKYEALKAELDSRSAELDEQKKKIDDRDNRHARRDIHNRLKETLRSRNSKFRLTRDTEAKRFPLHLAFALLIVGSACAAVYFGFISTHIDEKNASLYGTILAAFRATLAFGSFFGAVVFYIRWNNQWAQAHADEEFRLMRLDLDVDRASWLVEMLLEWRAEEGGEIPEHLIDRLASGLFSPDGKSTQLSHPVEDVISALLRTSGSLKIAFPNGEIGMDKKSIGAAKKEVHG